MFSFRKQQAAEHHIGNVKAMLATAEAAAIEAMKNKDKLAKNVAPLRHRSS
jgi:hypothetical protein